MTERRARIVHVAWSHGGAQEGISRSVTELCREQSAWADVSVAAVHHAGAGEGIGLLPVHLGRMERRLPFALGFAIASRRAVSRAGPFDIVHAHVPTFARADVATVHLFPPATLLRLVADAVRTAEFRMPDVSARRFRNVGLSKWTYALNINENVQIVCVSGRLAAAVTESYGVEPASIICVPLGIAPPDPLPPPAARPGEEGRVAVFVGHQYITKGLGFVIDALAKLGDAAPHLVVVGEGSEGSREAMEAYASERRVDAKVRFDGLQQDIWPYFAMADMLIYPTFFDTFGLAIGEALSAGCPVVTTRAAGIIDILPRTPALSLIDGPDDTDGLVRAIAAMPARDAVGQSAKSAVAALTWAAHARTIAGVYRTVFHSRGWAEGEIPL